MAKLRIVGGDGTEQIVDVRGSRVQIGRGRDNDVVLPDPEKGVSRTHAELRLENDRYMIVDLQSQNGTWLNGRRVERTEVPFGGEIAVGAYRLTLLSEAMAVPARPVRSVRADPLDDMRKTELTAPPVFAAPPAGRQTAGRQTAGRQTAGRQTAPSQARGVSTGVIGGAAVLIIVAVMIAWRSGVWDGAPDPSPASAAASDVEAAPPALGAPSTPGSADTRPAAPERTADVAGLPAGSPIKPPPVAAAGSSGGTRIQRRPGESAEAWRSRGAALQMRYGYSKAALDRGDFAAAAGGFEAILMEEPGFLDAPALLVQAQSGLRRSAQRLFQLGRGLDQAGDWVGALQKYQEARQIYADIPGLAEGLQRVRGQLRTAGTNAFNQARQLETSGRPEEALKEYEKALQWLPPDDPSRQVARARVEQLRRDD